MIIPRLKKSVQHTREGSRQGANKKGRPLLLGGPFLVRGLFRRHILPSLRSRVVISKLLTARS